MPWLYLALAVLGAALPYSQFLPWLGQHGLDVPALLAELFSTRAGAFFGLDVLVSGVVLLIFIVREGAARRIRYLWIPIVGTVAVGVSFGLPLFLFLRERERQERERR